MKNKEYLKILFFVESLLLLVAISNFSLWIDEGTTAFFSSFKRFNDLITYLVRYNGSEAQMPGYIIYIWMWGKVFGITEVALRAANLPFYILFIIILYRSSFSVKMKTIVLSITILNPFMWYNMNEARNTVIVFFLSFIVIINLLEFLNHRQEPKKIYLFVFLFLIGIAINLLFYFLLVPIAFLLMNYFLKNKIRLTQMLYANRIPLILFVFFSVGILVYYYFTLANGAGGMRERPSITNLAEIMYEFLGFLGLGPSRNEMREKMSVYMFLNYKYTLITYSGLIISLIIISTLFLKKQGANNIIFKNEYFIAFLLSLIFFFIGAYIMHFRFWGRHLAFAFPLLILYLASIIDAIFSLKPPKYFSYFLITTIVFLVFSSLRIRFSPTYQKDNYKLAAKMIIGFNNIKNFYVVWVGSYFTSEYYGLYFSDSTNISSFPKLIKVYDIDILENKLKFNDKKKIIVLFKKYDLFDSKRYLRNYILRKNYKAITEHEDFIIYEQQ